MPELQLNSTYWFEYISDTGNPRDNIKRWLKTKKELRARLAKCLSFELVLGDAGPVDGILDSLDALPDLVEHEVEVGLPEISLPNGRLYIGVSHLYPRKKS